MGRHWLGSVALVIALGWVTGAAAADKKYDPGVSDTEIRIGQSMPYSGPYSVFGQIGKAEQAYFAKINAEGGINGRKINLISLDDGYVPPKAFEQTRRLVEEDQVFLIFGSLGPATSMVVRPYLNPRKIPQLFVAAGDTAGGDYKHYPWTISWLGSLAAESRLYAEHILENRPNAKIAMLWLNDALGRDYLKGFKDGLGKRGSTMIVGEQTYESTDPTVDSQILALRASGADTFSSTRGKVREPGLPQDLRHCLAAAALHDPARYPARGRHQARRAGDRGRAHHRLLLEAARYAGDARRSGNEGLLCLGQEMGPGGQCRGRYRVLWLSDGAGIGVRAAPLRRRADARESDAGGDASRSCGVADASARNYRDYQPDRLLPDQAVSDVSLRRQGVGRVRAAPRPRVTPDELAVGVAPKGHGLERYPQVFAENGVDLTALLLLTDSDLERLAEERRLGKGTEERSGQADTLRLAGDVRLAMGDPKAAEASYREAIAIARQQSAKLWELCTAMGLARLCRDQGKRAEARSARVSLRLVHQGLWHAGAAKGQGAARRVDVSVVGVQQSGADDRFLGNPRISWSVGGYLSRKSNLSVPPRSGKWQLS